PVWPDTLSGRLPVVALVGHHPTNKLIGRGPIPHRKSFPPHHMHGMVLSGIRPSFPSLSRSAGQITHVLLTRSPLEHPQRGLSVRLACFNHAASGRPEPGSNSQNKNPHTKRRRQNSNQRTLTKTPKTGISKNKPHPHTGRASMAQKNNNKNKTTNPPIEFSNNPPSTAQQAPRLLAANSLADDEGPAEMEFPSGTSSRSTDWPRRDDLPKLRESQHRVKQPARRHVSSRKIN